MSPAPKAKATAPELDPITDLDVEVIGYGSASLSDLDRDILAEEPAAAVADPIADQIAASGSSQIVGGAEIAGAQLARGNVASGPIAP